MTVWGLVIGAGAVAEDVTRHLRSAMPTCRIHRCDTAASAHAWLDTLGSDRLACVLALFPSPEGDPDDVFLPIIGRYPKARAIVSTREDTLTGVAALADRRKVDLVVHESQLLSPRFLQDLSDQIRRFTDSAGIPLPQSTSTKETFIFSTPQSDDEIMATIVAGIDDCLGYQPRVTLPAGVRLTIEGEEAEEAMLCLHGQVALERESHAGNVLMHHESTGRIIGLLSLTDRREAFFTSRTTTEVTGVRLTFEQLNHVIRTRPETALLIAVLLIRSLDRRLRRAEDIQIEKVELTAQLEQEQEELRRTYRQLEAARAELMSQARFATLGELASGVAHEVNNPIGAIMRSTDHLLDDIVASLEQSTSISSRVSQAALQAALASAPLSTRQAREERRRLTDLTGDATLSRRLILAGVTAPLLADIMPTEIAGEERTRLLAQLERSASIGSGLRNLRSAASRINSLVDSLRSYARPDGDPLADIDIRETIEDTIRLLSHRLRDIDVVREYDSIPPITCHPAQLSQVWTNLIVNAADALQDAPEKVLTVTTSTPEPGWVRVTVADRGPGISPELLDHIFEPRFTTKSGRVHYGMGLGLTISKTIVERHGGSIRLESMTDGTVATVDLPMEAS
ncbi:ATP-binding protein [Flaviflexus equikiangi]|uniref:ATP-binding protein n=1 Tax=Flaviflexus equikiangi TaxID=2758573 RepID=UPI0015F5F912|nr:ATP-binding protein [Flaviflexus equikiangi]